MPGGLLQLAISSGDDNYLVSQPQISFFKSVYRKYTRFSIETIKDTPNITTLQADTDTNINIKIPRNGDLLRRVYLTFELPNIYSGYCDISSGVATDLYNFQWIENIGYNMIKEASISIGDSVIDRIYGEFMHINSELTNSTTEKDAINKLIGNVEEIHNPANSDGQRNKYGTNSSYETHKYPHITSGNQWTRFSGTPITIDNVNTNTTFPSIQTRKIKVPLDFWFSKNGGYALPLIALQYHEVKLDLKFRKIYDLYTILDALNTSSSHDLRIKPNSSSSYTQIQNFLADSSFVVDTSAGISTRELKNFNINTELEFDYIFLDGEERKRFALYDHEYLITQHHQRKVFTGISDDNYVLNISGNHPIQYIAVIPKRDDMAKINKFNNYSNWILDDIPPYSFDYTNETMFYNFENSKHMFYSNNGSAGHTSYYDKTYFKKNLISTMAIKFGGVDRQKTNDYTYYETQQPFEYFKTKPKDGINIYSFSLDPRNDQPSGACSFSNISDVKLDCAFNQSPVLTYYKIDVNVYLINYNVLKITSGMGSLEFT